jgi:acyl carrier protein
MNYIFFIAELEKHFGVTFSMDEVMSINCIGDLRKIVEERKK